MSMNVHPQSQEGYALGKSELYDKCEFISLGMTGGIECERLAGLVQDIMKRF